MRATQVRVSRANLIHNLKEIKKKRKAKILAVVKANAYGHGYTEIAKTLEQEQVDYFGVAYAAEGRALREIGIKTPILVLVPSTEEDFDNLVNFDLHFSISNPAVFDYYENRLNEIGKKLKAHIFVNTGMNRDGLRVDDALSFINTHNNSNSPIEIIGAMSHFATSDFKEKSFANQQIQEFDRFLKECDKIGNHFEFTHIENSGAIFNLNLKKYNMVRPGFSLHGYLPAKRLLKDNNLKPSLTLRSEIVHIQSVAADETVGYSMKYIADKSKKVGIIPLGYGDGYSVALTNKGECLINGKKHNLIGSVCMDQCMVDIGDSEVKVGDEVIFIGRSGESEINAYDIAEKTGVIPYEVVTSILERVPRTYY